MARTSRSLGMRKGIQGVEIAYSASRLRGNIISGLKTNRTCKGG